MGNNIHQKTYKFVCRARGLDVSQGLLYSGTRNTVVRVKDNVFVGYSSPNTMQIDQSYQRSLFTVVLHQTHVHLKE